MTADLASVMSPVLDDTKTAPYLVPLNNDDTIDTKNLFRFQFFPETISDTKAVTLVNREIIGGSHPLYQWMTGGERLITFTAKFITDTNPGIVKTDGYGRPTNVLGTGKDEDWNVDIRAAVAWLRQFVYPSYKDPSTGKTGFFPPRKLILVLPNSGINPSSAIDVIGLKEEVVYSSDEMLCLMNQCDIEYAAFFPNGVPREANITLSFVEIVQHDSFVSFHGADKMKVASWYYGFREKKSSGLF